MTMLMMMIPSAKNDDDGDNDDDDKYDCTKLGNSNKIIILDCELLL